MDYDILLAFVLATAALAISPGPDNIFVLIQSMVHGKKYGIATIAGLMTGCLVHATLLAFGVSALIKQNPNVYFSIKIFGALYMFYLAFKVLRRSDELNISNGHTEKKSLTALYRKGFIMNVLNPKVTIFFLAFFPGFLFSHFLNIIIQFYVLATIFILVSSIIFIAIAILAGSISKYIRENGQLGKILKWLQIVVFVAIAVYLLVSDN
ncbi:MULTISPECIES: LysE family translocator [unclassified Arenibacter]|jgi:threonine/homoserine/homoserine lactone efflux protein|uniref:LysE family translocator n=1 Tax=unclassified Arenibacter TaxID=2615047 RepID=UPI000E350F69|nr:MULTISPECIES: LysE family translocator [unclassified Arenibacter]MCM4165589.1 lysine transporter LysE [Arenibacter sp. A80]RFT54740.1 LysE family translocator [Arenibacter sp. P308M17]